MPELPEVETVRTGLNKLIVGKIVAKVNFDWPKSYPNSPKDTDTFLVGATINKVRRRAKVLMIDLSTGYSLVVHLKMTGQLVFVPIEQTQEGLGNRNWEIGKNKSQLPITQPLTPNSAERWGAGHPSDSLVGELPDKSTRVTITFTDDSQLFFNDQRKFGWMRLVPTAEIINIPFIQKLGPEPLEKAFTSTMFIERLAKKKNSNIKAALLDQTVLAGIGNIYADESLFMAGIHPESIVLAIPKIRLIALHATIVEVLQLSIDKGGSTNRNYVNAEGKRGSYTDFAKVFRREHQPCLNGCGSELIKIRVAGRGTHVCATCQRKYMVKK